eukprot:2835370-Alexandrium_andersonii.AAC.1
MSDKKFRARRQCGAQGMRTRDPHHARTRTLRRSIARSAQRDRRDSRLGSANHTDRLQLTQHTIRRVPATRRA